MSAKVLARQTILSLNIKQISVSEYDNTVDKNIEKLLSYIPKNERDSVWCYNVKPEFYIRADILPCYKYFILQTTHASFDENINKEIDDFLNFTPPKWIVFSTEDLQNANRTLLKKLDSEYQFIIDTNDTLMGQLCLYMRQNHKT